MTFECDICGHTTKTRAAIWKHKQSKHSEETDMVESDEQGGGLEEDTLTDTHSPPTVEDSDIDTDSPTSSPIPDWAKQFTYTVEETPTITAPTPLKAITMKKAPKKGTKKNKKQIEEESKNNLTMLKMGYKAVDNVANKYKEAINPSTKLIKRSDSDYDWVAKSTNAYMVENNYFISDYLSTGKIALVANAWFFGTVGASVYKDTKKVDGALGVVKAPFRFGKKLLSYIPVFGRRFRTKKPDGFIIPEEVMPDA